MCASFESHFNVYYTRDINVPAHCDDHRKTKNHCDYVPCGLYYECVFSRLDSLDNIMLHMMVYIGGGIWSSICERYINTIRTYINFIFCVLHRNGRMILYKWRAYMYKGESTTMSASLCFNMSGKNDAKCVNAYDGAYTTRSWWWENFTLTNSIVDSYICMYISYDVVIFPALRINMFGWCFFFFWFF